MNQASADDTLGSDWFEGCRRERMLRILIILSCLVGGDGRMDGNYLCSYHVAQFSFPFFLSSINF